APAKDAAASPLKTANSRVTAVTLYSNSALVTREVDVPEGKGTLELVVTQLPEQTVNSSLYSEGTDGIRVLTTRFRTYPVKEDTREDVRKADDDLKKLQADEEKLQSEIKTLESNIAMLAKMEDFTSANTKVMTEKGQLNGETIITLAEFVMKQRAEKNKELVALRQQVKDNKEQAQFVMEKRRKMTPRSNRMERDALIVVDKASPAPGKVRLNYLVESASWKPQYKLRAGKDKEAVQVEYLAALVQQTGESWDNVTLTLSTAQPMLNAAPPELKALEFTVIARSAVPAGPGFPGGGKAAAGGFAPQPAPMMELDKQAQGLRFRAQQELKTNNPGNAYKLINDAAAWEQNRELMQSREEVLAQNQKGRGNIRAAGDEGPSVTYHLKSKLSV